MSFAFCLALKIISLKLETLICLAVYLLSLGYAMVGKGDRVAKNGNGKPLLQQNTATSKTAQEVAVTPKNDKNLEIIGNLLKILRKLYCEEELEEGLEIRREEITEAVKAFNSHKKVREEINTIKAPIEEAI